MSAGYRVVDVTLKRKTLMTPSLMRCVFSGNDISQIKHESPDQRIKLLLPESNNCQSVPVSADWYQTYLAIPKSQRPIMRTYTLRHLDVAQQEMWVDFALHGEGGPASRWALNSQIGSHLQMVVPNAAFADSSGGFEWYQDEALQQVLLIADETALPAALGIIEGLKKLKHPPQVQAFFYVPLTEDIQSISTEFARIHWTTHQDQQQGENPLLVTMQQALILPENMLCTQQSLEEHSLSEDLLWERATQPQQFRAWIAAESGIVRNLRRYLIEKRGIPRELMTFMAYWSKGKITG